MERLRRLFKENRGFSMIELLTGFTIFAFFTTSLLQYMMTAATINSQVSSSVLLQTHASVAMGTIEEYLIEANAGVIFDDATDSLYIVNYVVGNDWSSSSTSLPYDQTCVAKTLLFRREDSTNEIWYYPVETTVTRTIDEDGDGKRYVVYEYTHSEDSSAKERLVENVQDFKVEFSLSSDESTKESLHLTFTMTNARETSEYEKSAFIVLRNSPPNEEWTGPTI